MATGRRIALYVGVTLLAAAGTLLPTAPARADCLKDIANSIANTPNAIGSPACDAALGESSAALAVFTGALSADQGLASQICNAVGDVNQLQSLIPPEVSQALGGLNPIDFAQCACDLSQGIDQIASEAASCLQGAICGIQQDLGFGPCSCQEPAPVAADCTPPLDCAGNNAPQSQCSNLMLQDTGVNPQPVGWSQLKDGSWFVLDTSDGWNGKSQYCSPDRYCICPAPLVIVQTPVSWNPGVDMISCGCPQLGPGQTTHAAAASGPLAEVCICDNTGRAAVPPDWDPQLNPTHSICPLPLTGIQCPDGQANWDGKCVPACAKGDVRTPDGKCCNPNQVTFCGQCCPQGYLPDPVRGICYQPQQTQ